MRKRCIPHDELSTKWDTLERHWSRSGRIGGRTRSQKRGRDISRCWPESSLIPPMIWVKRVPNKMPPRCTRRLRAVNRRPHTPALSLNHATQKIIAACSPHSNSTSLTDMKPATSTDTLLSPPMSPYCDIDPLIQTRTPYVKMIQSFSLRILFNYLHFIFSSLLITSLYFSSTAPTFMTSTSISHLYLQNLKHLFINS